MSPYFKALLVFMVVFCITGLVFDGLESTSGIMTVTFFSLVAACSAYIISGRSTD
ncbi:MAG: hypothetical protein Q4A82_04975 [Corynebacterium sp.]|nr:hypothetical protein [Corynebacterium sp.]